jgi:hypothetical protein
MIEAITATNSGNPIGRWPDETQGSALISVKLRTSLEMQSYRLCCDAATHVPGWLLRGPMPEAGRQVIYGLVIIRCCSFMDAANAPRAKGGPRCLTPPVLPAVTDR